MPPVTTIPSEETDDSDIPAFKVLNQDNLGPVGMVIGESIFKPFGRDNQKQKPNIVVYPTRRSNGNLEEAKNKTFTKSNGYISTQNKTNLKKNYSTSYGNLNQNHCNSAAKKRTEIEDKEQILDLNFTKTLDAKLRKLQKEEKTKKTKSANSNTAITGKPFISTVKKGTFLEPPAEITNFLRLNFSESNRKDGDKLYAYASRPRVLNRESTASSNSDVHKAKCEAAAIAAAVIASGVAGFQSAHNRAKRDINSNISKKGLIKEATANANAYPQKKDNVLASIATSYTLATAIAERFFKTKSNTTIQQCTRQVLGWKKAKESHVDVVNSNSKENDELEKRDGVPQPYANIMFDRRVVRGNTHAMHPMPTCDAESAASRQAEARRRALARRRAQNQKAATQRLRLQSPPPVAGRRHERVQTEKYLEELWERPPEADNCTQTDLFHDRPVSPFYVPVKTGVDAETQIYPGDLFDFDMEVVPILEVLVGKTVEQALIEVLEEEELAALREQQRRYLEIRAAELAETQRLEEQERRLRAERDRRVREHEEGCKVQQETEERIAAAVLMQGYIADLLPSVLEGLNETGFLYDNIKQNVDAGFMPWLMKEVSLEMENMVSSRDVLTDIVKEILEVKADMYLAMNAEPLEMYEEEEGEYDKTGDIELAIHKAILDTAATQEQGDTPAQPK